MAATHHWLLIVTLLIGATNSQVACPDGCVCHQHAVECSATQLRAIPLLAEDTTSLTIDSATFDDTTLRRANFSRFTQLTRLVLKGCSIQNIEPDTFADLGRLTSIDLTRNNLGEISPGAFNGVNITALFLDDNPNVQLTSETFRGLRTSILNLQKCSLTDFTKETVYPIQGLRKLFLNDNQIKRFNPDLELLFTGLESIKIYNNPIICDCESRWLKVFYNTVSHTDKIRDASRGTSEEPRCNAPMSVSGTFFSRLDLTDFMCQAPQINARISFENNQGVLECWASGKPQPSLAWYGPNGIINQTTPTPSESAPLVRLPLTIQLSDQYQNKNYTCVATNNAGNMTITTNVQWPFVSDLPNSQGPCNIIGETTTLLEDTVTENVFRSPYYTLVDLICAILGVFICTLVASVVILHFCVYKKRKASEGSSHNISSNYSSPSTSDSNYSANSIAENGHSIAHLQSINPQKQFIDHIQNRPLPYISGNAMQRHYMATDLPIIGLQDNIGMSPQQGQLNRAMTTSPSCEGCRCSVQSDRLDFRQPS